MNIDLTALILHIIEKYGLAGFAIGFWIWTGWHMQKRLEELLRLNNKMFGIMLSLVDERSRREITKSNKE